MGSALPVPKLVLHASLIKDVPLHLLHQEHHHSATGDTQNTVTPRDPPVCWHGEQDGPVRLSGAGSSPPRAVQLPGLGDARGQPLGGVVGQQPRRLLGHPQLLQHPPKERERLPGPGRGAAPRGQVGVWGCSRSSPVHGGGAGGQAAEAGGDGVYLDLLQRRRPGRPAVEHVIRAVYA